MGVAVWVERSWNVLLYSRIVFIIPFVFVIVFVVLVIVSVIVSVIFKKTDNCLFFLKNHYLI